jgi:ATP-dependent DNA helicase DinG
MQFLLRTGSSNIAGTAISHLLHSAIRMPTVEPGHPPGTLSTRVRSIFAAEGPLVRSLSAFEARPAQRAMADAVAEALESGRVLLVEAGTGTGKTLAYLIPALLSGRRVLVSTGTKNLQEQIVDKDLPVVAETIGRSFTATVMKGRSNYLCLHRFQALKTGDLARQQRLGGFGAKGHEVDERILLPMLERWAAETETGDRAELADLPEDLPLWTDLAASAENCLGTTCAHYQDCFVTRMRQRAAESDLVIVNHHLLFADAAVREGNYGAVIPDCDAAVLDEAHQLEDVATQYFGIVVSTYRLEELVRDARRVMAGWPEAERRENVIKIADRLDDRARRFFQQLEPVRRVGDERVRVTAESLADVQDTGLALLGNLEALEAALFLLKDASAGGETVRPSVLEDVLLIAARTQAIRSDLRTLLHAGDPDLVFFLEVRGRGVFLRAAPIDVSRVVREHLLERFQATVLTSATLTVDAQFDYVRRRLGIRRATELRLPSEFDYASQALLYLPRRMPPPRDPGFAQAAANECLEILRRTEGRAFVLFTSYAVLRAVEPTLAERLGYPLLVQGRAPRSALIDEFRVTPHAVLLATSSFWQGVDVMGDALSCVIIDKLPFASPGDPVTAARMEALSAAGGDAFGDYQVPLAILTLLQGLGRLIRHRQDRGVLAVLDPRLRTMGYGRRFLASMPPAPVTHDLDAISRFFER